jgi:hypothetical protein
MRGAWALAVALLVSAAAAGCVKEASGAAGDGKPRASFTEETGGVEGIVTDDEAVPVAGAFLQVIGTNRTANSTMDGAFAFDDLAPAQYLMKVKATGYVDKQVGFTVPVGNVTTLTVRLERVPPPVPFIDAGTTFEGYLAYAAEAKLPVPIPNEVPIYGGRDRLTVGGSTGSAVPERIRSTYGSSVAIDGDWQTILLEMKWQPTTSYGQTLWLKMIGMWRTSSTNCAASHNFLNATGTSPQIIRLERDDYRAMVAENPVMCELKSKGSMWFELAPSVGSGSYAVWLDQRVTIYVTVSYNAPLPADYTRLPPS